MNKLFINALKIVIITDNGKYGQCIKFEKGLNIIRAENTSGKSTLINGIFYALGLENILSNRHGPIALKPVLKEKLEYDGISANVLESYVLLEISNQKNEFITIKRQIIGNINYNLLKVSFGKLITNNTNNLKTDFFYLHRKGAAQDEKGFHNFLNNFLNLSLPYVSRFSGNDVPLYIECIIPLMFIEQTKGWSGIQATLPRSYGIENVNNVAFEYLLNMDIQKNRKLKEEINLKFKHIEDKWRNIKEKMKFYANSISATLYNFPHQILTNIPDDAIPYLIFNADDRENKTDTYLQYLREKLTLLDKKEIINSAPQEVLEEINSFENELILLYARLKQLNIDIIDQKKNLEKSQKRIEFLEKDIKRHKDIIAIIKMGAPEISDINNSKCPTCKQHINDILIPDIVQPMNLEDNIKYLIAQKESIELLKSNEKEYLNRLREQKIQVNNRILELHDKIKSIKFDFTSNSKMSKAILTEKIIIENKIKQIEKVFDLFETEIEVLKKIAKSYLDNCANEKKLPKHFTSDEDTEKLELCTKILKGLLLHFGYSSTNPDLITIDNSNYKPNCEGFEITFDSSASDNIRIIWAYTIALLYVSLKFSTNHFGIIIFDEPQQQKIKEASSKNLYKIFSKDKFSDCQSIVTTSEDKASLKFKTASLKCMIYEFGDKVMKPESEWLYQE